MTAKYPPSVDEATTAVRIGHRHDRQASGIDPSQLLVNTLQFSRERDYVGWDYFDGMSSRWLRSLPIENKWLNIGVQELIKRAPMNLRPLFRVEQRRNVKGTALFAMANASAFERFEEERYAEEVIDLADWLVAAQSDRYTGFCGGHRHAMQQLRERRPPNTPNVVTTAYAVRSLLRAAVIDPRYARVARSAETFLDEALAYRETANGATIKYHPLEDGSFETINGTAMGARLYTDLYEVFGDEQYRRRAGKLLDHVVANQADIGGWHYRVPASSSHLSMDNHHNGFIVESLLRYQQVTDDDRHRRALKRGLTFYRNRLFEPDGAPNWDEASAYPKDIHAATQGIITFAIAGDDAFARSILRWVIDTLSAGNGQFYYQRRRYYTKRFTLMRWCQAWMAYALSHLVTGIPRLPKQSSQARPTTEGVTHAPA